MIYLSSLLPQKFPEEAKALFSALAKHDISYALLPGTKDIWLRDFMPVRTRSGRRISFRYAPSYLSDAPALRTVFRRDIAPQLKIPVTYSDINLDGGNVVFAPSRRRCIISDRIYAENPGRDPAELAAELAALLEAEVILIPSLCSDMTGHADGMVRFLDEHTVLCNDIPSVKGLEQCIKKTLQGHGIRVTDFPYFSCGGDSAVGCYLNYLETESCIFLPVFGVEMDETALQRAREVFRRPVVPVNIREVAEDGGCLNCITWEDAYAQ